MHTLSREPDTLLEDAAHSRPVSLTGPIAFCSWLMRRPISSILCVLQRSTAEIIISAEDVGTDFQTPEGDQKSSEEAGLI